MHASIDCASRDRAAKRGNYEIVRYILDKRIRLNRAGSNSSSTTSDHNHNNNQPEQDTNAANLDELTLSRAPSNSWGIQSEMYVEQRAGERSKGRTALHNAAASGHVNIVRQRIVRRRASRAFKLIEHTYCSSNKMEYLIQQRANVDTEDFDGMTPLFSAVCNEPPTTQSSSRSLERSLTRRWSTTRSSMPRRMRLRSWYRLAPTFARLAVHSARRCIMPRDASAISSHYCKRSRAEQAYGSINSSMHETNNAARRH